MVRYVILQGSAIVGVATADDPARVGLADDQRLIEHETAGPNWTVGPNDVLSPPEIRPEPIVAEQPRTRFSFLEFMDLFTGEEQLAIAGAAMTDVATKLWYDRAVGAQFIDLADERLSAGLHALVTAGLLTSARRNRVLKGLPPT